MNPNMIFLGVVLVWITSVLFDRLEPGAMHPTGPPGVDFVVSIAVMSRMLRAVATVSLLGRAWCHFTLAIPTVTLLSMLSLPCPVCTQAGANSNRTRPGSRPCVTTRGRHVALRAVPSGSKPPGALAFGSNGHR